MPFVISTLSQSVDYSFYNRRIDGKSVVNVEDVEKRISIKGGQGVIDRRTLITPENGVVTEITAEQAERLKDHPVFKIHAANGFVRIVNSKPNEDKPVKDLETGDDSAQLTVDDFAPEAEAAEAQGEELKINNTSVPVKRNASRSRKRGK